MLSALFDEAIEINEIAVRKFGRWINELNGILETFGELTGKDQKTWFYWLSACSQSFWTWVVAETPQLFNNRMTNVRSLYFAGLPAFDRVFLVQFQWAIAEALICCWWMNQKYCYKRISGQFWPVWAERVVVSSATTPVQERLVRSRYFRGFPSLWSRFLVQIQRSIAIAWSKFSDRSRHWIPVQDDKLFKSFFILID